MSQPTCKKRKLAQIEHDEERESSSDDNSILKEQSSNYDFLFQPINDSYNHCLDSYGSLLRYPSNEEVNTMYKFLTQIMPIRSERGLLLQVCCNIFSTRNSSKLIVLYGPGSNGKTKFIRLLEALLNYFSPVCNLSSVCNCEQLFDSNDRKLLMILSESYSEKIDNHLINKFLNGTLNRPTVICCSNDLKSLADLKNVTIIPFRSKFTSDQSKINPDKFIYPIDKSLNDPNFFERHVPAFFEILSYFNRAITQRSLVAVANNDVAKSQNGSICVSHFNIAEGQNSSICGGHLNVASGQNSFACCGSNNISN